MKKDEKLGIVYAGLSYLLWGLFPLYWKLLKQVPAYEILANRIFWSFLFMLGFLLVTKKWSLFRQTFRQLIQQPKMGLTLFFASVLISANWFLYIWAVNQNHIIETSLGYYINPLVSVLLGVLILKEKLSKAQVVSFLLALTGVLILTISYGNFPWVALGLAVTFGLYGLAKKVVKVESATGLTLETLLITPFSLLFLLYLNNNGELMLFHQSVATDLLLIGGGIVTAVPLLYFAKGAQRIPLYMIGFLQYVTPTMSLLIGIFIYHEPFSTIKFISFTFIWAALFVFSLSQIRFFHRNGKNPKRKSEIPVEN
ncbi:EamA family transporter RarD [Bacillus smithii]|uniref:EamA family transporter RarD n=1 Tax=Bacillus smithii TaxID=1479 RepID=UPI003D1FF42E